MQENCGTVFHREDSPALCPTNYSFMSIDWDFN